LGLLVDAFSPQSFFLFFGRKTFKLFQMCVNCSCLCSRTVLCDKIPERETTTSSTLCCQGRTRTTKVGTQTRLPRDPHPSPTTFMITYKHLIATTCVFNPFVCLLLLLLLLLLLCVADMYYLCEGPESYHYLSQSGCVQDVSLDDKNLFDSVMVRKTQNT